MNEQTIAPAEAWEEVEKRKLEINFNRRANKWCASSPGDKWELGWGATPLEALSQLLSRIAEADAKAEAANASL